MPTYIDHISVYFPKNAVLQLVRPPIVQDHFSSYFKFCPTIFTAIVYLRTLENMIYLLYVL